MIDWHQCCSIPASLSSHYDVSCCPTNGNITMDRNYCVLSPHLRVSLFMTVPLTPWIIHRKRLNNWRAPLSVMDRVNCGKRAFLLAVELGRNIRDPVTPEGHNEAPVTRPRDGAVSRGQPGLTGPQRERGEEREVGALTPGLPEGSAQVTSTHCFCLPVCA